MYVGYKIKMTLYETIGSDIKDAMKAKDSAKLETLRLISAELTNYEKANKGNVLDDETTTKILTKEFTKRMENYKFYTDKGIDSGAAKELTEANIIKVYLPAVASEEDVIQAVATLFKIAKMDGRTLSVKDTGAIMSDLTAIFKSTGEMFDRKIAAQTISNLLKTQSNG